MFSNYSIYQRYYYFLDVLGKSQKDAAKLVFQKYQVQETGQNVSIDILCNMVSEIVTTSWVNSIVEIIKSLLEIDPKKRINKHRC